MQLIFVKKKKKMFFAAFKSEKNQNWQFGARILDGYLEESVTADSEPSPACAPAGSSHA